MKKSVKLIVSLTSYPARIDTVYQTVESILNQTLAPHKVVLYLGMDRFPKKEQNLPANLLKLRSDRFEIHFVEKDLRSYTKLIPALREFPDDIIVTADDDIVYPENWLALLYDGYKKFPKCIQAHRGFVMRVTENEILPYLCWPRGPYIQGKGYFGVTGDNSVPGFKNFFTGVSGTLYPPHSLHPDVMNEKLFKSLAPTEDDVWFWAMAVHNGTKINIIQNNLGVIGNNPEANQEYSLYRINSQNDCTNSVFTNVFEAYPDVRDKVMAERDKIIVSLTSFPARISTVHQTIESLLKQTKKADKVILWLAPEQFPNKEKDLPQKLLNLCDCGLTIDWYHDIKSYKKFIPSLKKYPNDIIVTADDDLIYEKDWLEKLVASYIKYPKNIHCHRAHGITMKDNSLSPYRQWLWCKKISDESFNNFCTTGAGALYPHHCLHPDAFVQEQFIKLAPTADDIWFWAMAVHNGTRIRIIENANSNLTYVPGTQEGECLWQENGVSGKNDEQLQNVLEEYPDVFRQLERWYGTENTYHHRYYLFGFIPLFSVTRY